MVLEATNNFSQFIDHNHPFERPIPAVISSAPKEKPNIIDELKIVDFQPQATCIKIVDALDCGSFRLKRTTPFANNMLDIIANVRDWKDWRQWRDAFLRSWSDGLNYLTARCQVLNMKDNYLTATRTVFVSDIGTCTREL